MSLNVMFHLDESDLEYFRDLIRNGAQSSITLGDDEVVDRASKTLEQLRQVKLPQFVSYRLERLSLLIKMLGDSDWKLEEQERQEIILALAYFADPEDLIPDEVPVLGYIDDAIMIELVARELIHEIDAYRDFCEHRSQYLKTTDGDESTARASWLAKKRKQLYGRMRRRQENSSRERGGGKRLRLF